MVHQDYECICAPDTMLVGEGQRLGAESLEDFFARTSEVAVAFSGGVDSAYLLAYAHRAGCRVKAYFVSTVFQPTFELEDAREVVDLLGVQFEIIEADILKQSAICANPPNRCYVCKRFIFQALRKAASRDGFDVLVDGTNASDNPARRPGFKALDEEGVISPLRRAALTKEAIRKASRVFGLPTADKPRFACLAVHVPQGVAITPETLQDAARACGVTSIFS